MGKKIVMATLMALLMATSPLLARGPEGPKARRWKDLEVVRMWRLTDELDLSEEEASKVFPILKRYGERRRQLHLQRNKLLKELQELVAEKASQEALRGKIAEIEQINRKLEGLRWEEWEDLKRVLTPSKQARYLLFHRRFVKDIWRITRGCRTPPRGEPSGYPLD